MPSAHAAVTHELLVRYLDAWLPTVLHGHKRVTYVDRGSAEASEAARRVFAEFPDLLARHTLTVVSDGQPLPANPGPVFGFFEFAQGWETLPGADLLVVTPHEVELDLPLRARVSLVGDTTETLVFGTASERSLETFKNDLWALDEYAGTRYRDPGDPAGTLLDISLQPNLRPLRRLIGGYLAGGPQTLAALRTFALHETIYRAEDATRAVQAMVAAGEVSRDPTAGRLSPTTLISLPD